MGEDRCIFQTINLEVIFIFKLKRIRFRKYNTMHIETHIALYSKAERKQDEGVKELRRVESWKLPHNIDYYKLPNFPFYGSCYI